MSSSFKKIEETKPKNQINSIRQRAILSADLLAPLLLEIKEEDAIALWIPSNTDLDRFNKIISSFRRGTKILSELHGENSEIRILAGDRGSTKLILATGYFIARAVGSLAKMVLSVQAMYLKNQQEYEKLKQMRLQTEFLESQTKIHKEVQKSYLESLMTDYLAENGIEKPDAHSKLQHAFNRFEELIKLGAQPLPLESSSSKLKSEFPTASNYIEPTSMQGAIPDYTSSGSESKETHNAEEPSAKKDTNDPLLEEEGGQ